MNEGILRAHHHGLTDRILAGPETVRHGLIDHDDWRFTRSIYLRNAATFQYPRSHHFEIAGPDHPVSDPEKIRTLRRDLARNREVRGPPGLIARRRQAHRITHSLNRSD